MSAEGAIPELPCDHLVKAIGQVPDWLDGLEGLEALWRLTDTPAIDKMVYREVGMARTNIVIDDALIAEAMALTGAKTKREAVDLALKRLVSRSRAFRALRTLRGQAAWDGDVAAWRRGRDRDASR